MAANEASSGKFFGGCLVILLLVGGVVGFFYQAKQKASARKSALRAELLDPYWNSLGTDEFMAQYSENSTPKRVAKATAEVLNEKFLDFTAEHGPLKNVIIRSLNEEMVLGTDDAWLKVETVQKFEKGRLLRIVYKLQEQKDGSYLIDIVTTNDRAVDLPLW